MIKDGLLQFSNISTGDSPTLVADNASANVIDQSAPFPGGNPAGGGGSYDRELFLYARAHAAFTSAGSTGTLAIVLQDSADNVTYADVLVGPTNTVPAINAELFKTRLPQGLRRYLRLVYRIATQAMTAGTVDAFLTPDVPTSDLSTRKSTDYLTTPSGAMDESQNQGVLAQ